MNIRNFTYQGFDDFNGNTIIPEVKLEELVEEMPTVTVSAAIFTVEDMELAKTLAREEGIQQGKTEAEKDFAEGEAAAELEEKARAADLLDKIQVEMVALKDKAIESNQKAANEISALAMAIAKKVCGEVAARAIEDEIAAIINSLKDKLDQGEMVKIYLNPGNIGVLNDIFTNASLNVDNAIALGDFRVEWKNGFAEKNLQKLWKTIEQICSRHSSLEENVAQEINNNEVENG